MKQRNSMSPELFSAELEGIFRWLKWNNEGLVIDGKRLHHLRFANNQVLLVEMC